MDLSESIKVLLPYFGGSIVVLSGLSIWLGRVWSNRIHAKEKLRNDKELVRLRRRLSIEQGKEARYIESQFNSYNAIWNSLSDLKIAGDALWRTANMRNLEKFTAQLKKTEEIALKNSPLIEDNHFKELNMVVKTFWNFQVGKSSLVDLYRRKGRVEKYEIRETILHNEQIMEEYNKLILEICNCFRRQMKGA